MPVGRKVERANSSLTLRRGVSLPNASAQLQGNQIRGARRSRVQSIAPLTAAAHVRWPPRNPLSGTDRHRVDLRSGNPHNGGLWLAAGPHAVDHVNRRTGTAAKSTRPGRAGIAARRLYDAIDHNHGSSCGAADTSRCGRFLLGGRSSGRHVRTGGEDGCGDGEGDLAHRMGLREEMAREQLQCSRT